MTSPNPMALEAKALGPRKTMIERLSCEGCPALATKDWSEELENDESDGGTSADCTAAHKVISAYWNSGHATPAWCPYRGNVHQALPPPAAGEGLEPVAAAKPLEWLHPTGWAWTAGDIGITYYIDRARRRLPFSLAYPSPLPRTDYFASLEDAQAAAQDDYDQRIRSALSATPAARAAVLSDGQFELLRQLAKADLRNAAMTVPPAEAANLNALLRNGYAEFDSAGRLGSPFFGVTEAGRAALKEKT